MAALFTGSKFSATDSSGNPLASGKVYTYAAGTTTPKATYTTQAGDVANANPVILDSTGRANIWLGTGAYKFVVTDSTGAAAPDGTVDNVTAPALEISADLASTSSATKGAGLVGFNDALSYAAGTVGAKLREIVSVTDFGAVGDGVTDDTTAFTDAQGSGNVTVLIPPGTYLLNNLRIKTGVRLLGSGYESTILKQGAAGNYAIACTSDVSVGQLSSVELSNFKVEGATSATVAAVIVSAAGVFAVWKSKFDFVAADTYRALEVQASAANNVFRCEFKVTSQDTSDTAVVINGGTYNTFDFFLTNCMSGKSLDFVGLACFFVRSISDGQQKFAGSHTVANSVTVEEWPGSAISSEAAIESEGFSETFINPMVILTAASTGKIDFAFRPFDNTVFINPKVLAPVLDNPFQADNAYSFTIVGPGQSTTTNKMNTIFADTSNTSQNLRRVSFVGDCSQWVTANRPSGGAAIQYAAPLAASTVAVLNNTDTLILEPAGTLATLTIALPNLPVDGQVITVSSSQAVTTLTVTAPTSGANVSLAPAAITANVPFSLVYRASGNKFYRA